VGIVTPLDERWPGIALDPLLRLRVLAATLPGVALVERTLPVPFDEVWSFITDLERSIPAFDNLVRSVRILEQSPDGRQLRLRAWPSPFPFRVELSEGLCLMHSAAFMVGMAAEPLGDDSTRFGHLEGVPASGPRLVRAMKRPLVSSLRAVHRRNARRDLDGMERCLRQISQGR
jgi:hypothetical protein